MLSLNISNIAIITVKNSGCTIHNISKSEATDVLRNSAIDDLEYI